MPFSDTYLYRAQHSCLMEYDLEAHQARELAHFTHVVEAPFYSRDGKSLYYNCEGRIYPVRASTATMTMFCLRMEPPWPFPAAPTARE